MTQDDQPAALTPHQPTPSRPASQQTNQTPLPTPLEQAGRIANEAAGRTIFGRYLAEKSENTIKRHARDLELFAEYLLDIGIPLVDGADFQTNPAGWRGVTWGIVEGFVKWLLQEGYAVSSVNARLSTVRTYAGMAVKAGVIDRQEGVLIQSVKGFSRQRGLNVDEQREQSRKDEITYAYKPAGSRRTIVVNRSATKKREPTLLTIAQAIELMQPRNASPQGWRDALMMAILLEHGLRASEAALLTVENFDLRTGLLRFFRPKVKGTKNEWTTHQLMAGSRRLSSYYIDALYPPALKPASSLILATTRLLKNGSGGQLLAEGLNRVRISERVAYLGRQIGVEKLSAHDCRHFCATQMARLGYGVDELMAWFGWTSAQTAMRYVAEVEVKERYLG